MGWAGIEDGSCFQRGAGNRWSRGFLIADIIDDEIPNLSIQIKVIDFEFDVRVFRADAEPPMKHNLYKLLLTLAVLVFTANSYGILTVTIVESGSDVIATGSGTLDTTGLTQGTSTTSTGALRPSNLLRLGAGGAIDTYDSISTASLGSSSTFVSASSGTGDNFGFFGSTLFVPGSYSSGSSLTGTATWNSNTIAGLGLDEGVYNLVWGSDSINITIGAAPVPEPGTYALVVAFISLFFVVRRRRQIAVK